MSATARVLRRSPLILDVLSREGSTDGAPGDVGAYAVRAKDREAVKELSFGMLVTLKLGRADDGFALHHYAAGIVSSGAAEGGTLLSYVRFGPTAKASVHVGFDGAYRWDRGVPLERGGSAPRGSGKLEPAALRALLEELHSARFDELPERSFEPERRPCGDACPEWQPEPGEPKRSLALSCARHQEVVFRLAARPELKAVVARLDALLEDPAKAGPEGLSYRAKRKVAVLPWLLQMGWRQYAAERRDLRFEPVPKKLAAAIEKHGIVYMLEKRGRVLIAEKTLYPEDTKCPDCRPGTYSELTIALSLAREWPAGVPFPFSRLDPGELRVLSDVELRDHAELYERLRLESADFLHDGELFEGVRLARRPVQ